MRNPAAVSLISMPRLEYSAVRAARAAFISCSSGRTPSSNSWTSSAACNGLPAASKAASITFLMCDSFISLLTTLVNNATRFNGTGLNNNGRLVSQHLLAARSRRIVVTHDTQGPIGAGCPYMQRGERLSLHDVDQPLAHQLEDGDEGHRDAHPSLLRPEEAHEFYETGGLKCGKDVTHTCAD